MYSFRESANNGEYSYVTLRERPPLDETHRVAAPGRGRGGGGDERLCCGHGEARDKLNGDMASVRASKTAAG